MNTLNVEIRDFKPVSRIKGADFESINYISHIGASLQVNNPVDLNVQVPLDFKSDIFYDNLHFILKLNDIHENIMLDNKALFKAYGLTQSTVRRTMESKIKKFGNPNINSYNYVIMEELLGKFNTNVNCLFDLAGISKLNIDNLSSINYVTYNTNTIEIIASLDNTRNYMNIDLKLGENIDKNAIERLFKFNGFRDIYMHDNSMSIVINLSDMQIDGLYYYRGLNDNFIIYQYGNKSPELVSIMNNKINKISDMITNDYFVL